MATIDVDPALSAYEALAPFYNAYTADYGHERWLGNLESRAVDLGLDGNELLDVACGTGHSFLPLLARGYEVTACDISPSMAERAAAAAAELGGADVRVADMRELPRLGAFDLVTCLDDALNYLLSDEELEEAMHGFARNLRPGGLVVFDLNTLGTYRGFFTRDAAVDSDGTFFCWRGEADEDAAPGVLASSTIEVFFPAAGDNGSWRRTRSRHVQRHHSPAHLRELLGRAGHELLDLRGQVTGEFLDPDPSEDRHVKFVYFARRSTRR
jgi:SAM-dependent methyltransferase